ncbi:MAG: energy-coupling factor transporter transmembrane protein EcfT [Treponema sp.]|nr:energy-coupling factor transporter transmembrane protein EcfT [Treponema sp.]
MIVVSAAGSSGSRFQLDPRTKIVLLFFLNIPIISGGYTGTAGIIRAFFVLLPLALLLAEHKWRASFWFALFLCAALSTELFLMRRTTGALNLALAIFGGLLSRYVPGFVMGYYLLSSTRVSELIASLERLRISRKIVIPFAVMMRFAPTLAEEYAAIKDAMRMRGIYFGGGNALKIPEYRMVPLLMSAVKTGEELSAAALTRGLGKPVERTNLCRIGFGVKDIFLLTLCLGAFAAWLYFKSTGR